MMSFKHPELRRCISLVQNCNRFIAIDEWDQQYFLQTSGIQDLVQLHNSTSASRWLSFRSGLTSFSGLIPHSDHSCGLAQPHSF
jgi:hypothetical protein